MNHLQIALSQYGIKEIAGQKDNPEVLKYFYSLGFNGKDLHDETAWCAAFANWVLKTAGLRYQRKLNARSFLQLGEEVHPDCVQQGDIVVLWRESKDSWKGHVGFYIRENKGWIYVLGGNQSNQVKISAYPKERLLQYRRVTK